MSPLLQNDSEQAMGMVRALMTHSDVINHFHVAKCRNVKTNDSSKASMVKKDRPRSDRPHETPQRQNRATRLLHLRNRTLNVENTARGIPGCDRNQISGQTVRKSLRT